MNISITVKDATIALVIPSSAENDDIQFEQDSESQSDKESFYETDEDNTTEPKKRNAKSNYSMNAPRWIELEKCVSKYCSRPIMLNREEFMVASDATASPKIKHGLYVYNIVHNKWKLFVAFNKAIKCSFPSLALDRDNQIIYMIGHTKGMVVIDAHTKQYKLLSNARATGMYSPLTVINGVLHLFTGSANTKHLRWNAKSKTFDALHTFAELSSGNTNPGLSHINRATTNDLYLFGGQDDATTEYFDVIWSYSHKIQKWKRLEMKLPRKMMHFGYATTYDEQYILISGGEDSNQTTLDTIYIVDMNEQTVFQSSVCCPKAALFHSTVMPESNDRLVRKYIEQESTALNINIPNEISVLLCKWYSTDYLYLINDEKHWKIAVHYLISNMNSTLQ